MVTTRGRRNTVVSGDEEEEPRSGSEYQEEDHHTDRDADGEPEEEEPEPEVELSVRGRKRTKVNYQESGPSSGDDDEQPPRNGVFTKGTRKSTRQSTSSIGADEDDDEQPRRSNRRLTRSKNLEGFVEEDSDSHMHDEDDGGSSRRRLRNRTKPKAPPSKPSRPLPTRRSSRRQRAQDNDYTHHDESSDSHPDSVAEDDMDLELEPEPAPEPDDDNDGKPYSLRTRQKVNYAIPPPLEEMTRPPPKPTGRSRGGPKKTRGLGWSASGAELGRWMGMPGNDSDSDNPTRTPRKSFGMNPFGAGAVAAGGVLPGSLGAAGTPSNLGKISDASLADADPLGVNTNVTFDEVGGLDEHIHSLKEMTLLPLLYPEVFQRFNVTPPRGVLFHGPPGTGKTLLARALAASSRSGGRQISFFMRKGADCLSKWVGEAERQLRLLFEEARNSQPSIIFFDEIDGLAPVRSSKQDQIHASIVSTLLALMDGMDGRGQVIVIGATNRPDAVDPALRRPGRFDREFYFGLPGLDAREKILGIMTRKWENWDPNQEGEKGEQVKEKLKGLAKMTKGYGGADLRALCTEAALNAIQRRYPQVYKSQDRLLLKPETIDVGLRDFMMSIKKIVPSSARSTTSAATPLPPQFEPLLSDTLENVRNTIQRVMPIEKPLTALQEAEFEDAGGEDSALEREMLSQSMQTLRVYRPRVVIHGSVGMGQGYIGAAALHHLEGYHVQSLELGSLMGDSTRTVESAIVQLFVEAKRHQPSVIYIPSLFGWCAAVSESSRSTVRAMLETLLPTDPILLLAVVDGPFSALPRDVKLWFGPSRDNRVELISPSAEKRAAFFEPLLKDVARKPNEFADGVKRRKRVLEELPIAPPLEPRKPTAAELAAQEENDQSVLLTFKMRVEPILQAMKRKFKRFTKKATEEYKFEADEDGVGYAYEVNVTAGAPGLEQSNGIIDISHEPHDAQPAEQPTQAVEQAMLQQPPLYDMDLDKMISGLYKDYYFTPQDVLNDVGKMVHNAEVRSHEDLDRMQKAQAMFTFAQVSFMEFDPTSRMEYERVKARYVQRREAEAAKDKGKEKDKDNEERTEGVQTRRSTRSNGIALASPGDPVRLERTLKRARSAGDHSGAERDTSASVDDNGAIAGGSQAGAWGDGDEPQHKRSKMLVDEDEDELNGNLRPSPMPHARHSVRFANSPHDVGHGHHQMPPMADYGMHPQQQHSLHHQPIPQPNFQPGQHQRPLFQPQQQPNLNFPHQSFNAPPPQQHFMQPPNRMAVDGMNLGRPQHGFDPTLLNPTSPTEMPQSSSMFNGHDGHGGFNHGEPPDLFNGAGPSAHMQPGFGPASGSYLPPQQSQPQHSSFAQNWQQQPHQQQHGQQGMRQPIGMQTQPQTSVFNDDPFNAPPPPMVHQQQQHQNHPQPYPEMQPQHQSQQHQQQLIVPQPVQQHARTPSPHRITSILRTPEPERRPTPNEASGSNENGVLSPGTNNTENKADDAVEASAPAPEVVPMVVERSPSPPLPDFYLDETLLDELRVKLKEETEKLTIEQLEQLRATCLGEVWRQRKEWDRDGLVKALIKGVDDFLEEVKELEEWDGED